MTAGHAHEHAHQHAQGHRDGHEHLHAADAEALDATLRARGMRATPQRRLVLRALADLGHATPEQVEEQLRTKGPVTEQRPQVNLSTVYRTLELLEQLGVVSHAHLTHGPPTYQVAAHADHFHLVCRGCGNLVEADLAVARTLADTVLADHGFTADLTHLSLHGWCAACRQAGLPASEATRAVREATPGSVRLHSHD